MKKLLSLVFVYVSFMSFAQKPYTNCSAVFLNNKMLVEEYTDTAQCQISIDAQGELIVGTVELGENYSKLVDKQSFSVAIKDKATGTMLLITAKPIKELAVATVLAKCKKGDKLIILTTDSALALPHNEIVVY